MPQNTEALLLLCDVKRRRDVGWQTQKPAKEIVVLGKERENMMVLPRCFGVLLQKSLGACSCHDSDQEQSHNLSVFCVRTRILEILKFSGKL